MRVAQFIHRYPPALGGAEAWAERLSGHLIAEGHKVTVWTTTALDLSAFTRTGYREVASGSDTVDGVVVRRYRPEFRFPGRRILFKVLAQIPGNTWRAMTQPWGPISLRMWKDAKKDADKDAEKDAGVDAVHAVAFPYASILRVAQRVAMHLRVPFVVTPFLHLGDPNNPNDRIRQAYTAPHLISILRAADRVLVQTPTESRAVVDLGIEPNRVVLQGLGVDPAECTGGDRESARAAWNVKANEIVVGHLANLSLEKGTPDLLAAAEMARQAGTPIRVVLAGPEMPSFKRFWKWSGPDEWIVRLGELSDSQRRDFYAGIDIFALPSTSDSFGLVFLEAWANAVPVIAYCAGGVVDVIRHEQDGLLVPCGNLDALSAAIRRLANEPDVRVTWGRAGNDRLSRDFHWPDKLRIATDAITRW